MAEFPSKDSNRVRIISVPLADIETAQKKFCQSCLLRRNLTCSGIREDGSATLTHPFTNGAVRQMAACEPKTNGSM